MLQLNSLNLTKKISHNFLIFWFFLLLPCYQANGLMRRAFANGPRDQRSIPGRGIPKTQKIVLDPTLLSTQSYKVRIKGKVEQSREWSSAPYNYVL